MRESKRATALRAIRCSNNYDLLKRFGDAATYAIEYYPYEPHVSRGWSRTYIWTPHKKQAMEYLGKRSESWPLALSWARTETGHTYVASPFGGHIPEQVLQRALAAANNQKGT